MQGREKYGVRPSRHWAERAEEARTLAEQMVTPQAMALMLDIAERYDAIAQRAAELEGQRPTSARLN